MQQSLFDQPVEENKPQDNSVEALSRAEAGLSALGIFEPVDRALRDFLRKKGETCERVLFAALLLSAANRFGHTSLHAAQLKKSPDQLFGSQEVRGEWFEDTLPGERDYENSPVSEIAKADVKPVMPLVYDDGRFYFNRYFSFERNITAKLLSLADADAGAESSGNPEEIKRFMHQLFDSGPESAYQRMAAACSLRRRLTVVTGGPGTGKTYTVLRMLLLLIRQSGERPLRIAVAAPTGKAANRVRESMLQGIEALRGINAEIDEMLPLVPAEARTIHRLLGVRHQSSHFRFNPDNPLPYDVVVVDEASMVDMPLMARLLGALRKDARLILLGDKHQLASVESGAVFADICHQEPLNVAGKDLAEFCKLLDAIPESLIIKENSDVPRLTECIVELEHSRRFGADSGIGRLASAIKRGDEAGVFEILDSVSKDVAWIDGSASDAVSAADVKSELTRQFEIRRNADTSAMEKLDAAGTFQILCAHRKGPDGVHDVNQRVEAALGIRLAEHQAWYEGRPVIMTKNDYQLNFFNGDHGVTVPGPNPDGKGAGLRVAMETFNVKKRERDVRYHPVARLENAETCWALSVHKSQGSEYDTVLLILPPADSPVLTRELLYTAITRARERVIICGTKAIIKKAIARKTLRFSGLSKRLSS